MKTIQLWTVDRNGPNGPSATVVGSVDNTETEAILEDILTRSPNLLADNLVLIGRQLPTEGGPLDLLGVDEDGGLVVFELKRGTLTRDAVAQILDYVSDLSEMDPERLGKLVEDYSGRLGIEKIEDFEDWYGQRFPDSDGPSAQTPRAILVGLGADDRARRIVNFLVNGGIDIQLLTYHAFMNEGRLLLARQVESVSPISRQLSNRSSTTSKEGNLQVLREQARSLGVTDFLEDITGFLKETFPAYAWPGKMSYTYYLTERTDQGKPTQRAYLSLYLNSKTRNTLVLILMPRTIEVAPESIQEFEIKHTDISSKNQRTGQLEITLVAERWDSIKQEIEVMLSAVVEGWKVKTSTPLVETQATVQDQD